MVYKNVMGILAVILMLFIAAGCSWIDKDGDSDSNNQILNKKDNFKLLVSDAPADIADFEYLNVEITKVRIFKKEGNDGESFKDVDVGEVVDISKLVGEISTEVLSSYLEVGNYTKIELYVGSIDGLALGEVAKVEVPSDKLQLNIPFEVLEGQTVSFVFDMNVVRKGSENEYNLLPVIAESGLIGRDLDESDVREVNKKNLANMGSKGGEDMGSYDKPNLVVVEE